MWPKRWKKMKSKKPSAVTYWPLGLFAVLVLYMGSLLFHPQGDVAVQGESIDRPMPSFTIKNDQGTRYTPQDLNEEIEGAYLINFFASWCAPCRAEHETLMQLRKKGVKIVGINYKDNQKDRVNFLTGMGNPYTVVLVDDKGLLSIPFGISGMPESFLVDDGRIIWHMKGPMTGDAVVELQNKLSFLRKQESKIPCQERPQAGCKE
jgi:cytochrome c biogenesis protein CcmG/thiol:disulfide interchange protein DsbE